MKKKLLVSFSGGETSAFMAIWLWLHKRDEYDMIFVFANTGQENEETLQFVRDVAAHYSITIVWIEAVAVHGKRAPVKFRIVDYLTAARDGQPFEDIIKKYGIPNMSTPHCTRELKQSPIRQYAKSIGWDDYETAIGIRIDEIDRLSAQRKANKLIYPLVSMMPMTKQKINFWWSQQPFRLPLKGYQGNCVTCWKKSDKKLFTIAKENERLFNFFSKMELRYGNFVPETRVKLMTERGDPIPKGITFFRKNRSAIDIINESKIFDGSVIDDTQELDSSESCEVFTECGTDN